MSAGPNTLADEAHTMTEMLSPGLDCARQLRGSLQMREINVCSSAKLVSVWSLFWDLNKRTLGGQAGSKRDNPAGVWDKNRLQRVTGCMGPG